jgi:hypothetical protein
VRSSTNPGSAGTLSNAITSTAQVAPARIAVERLARSTKADEEDQNS